MLIHFKSMQVVGITLQSHQKATERHVGRPENRNSLRSVSQKLDWTSNKEREQILQMFAAIMFKDIIITLSTKVKVKASLPSHFLHVQLCGF